MIIRDIGLAILGCICLILLKGCAVLGSKEEELGELEDSAKLELGDLVRITVSKEQLQQMQEGHGDYNEDMAQEIGKIGEVTKVRRDGNVAVKFIGTPKSWIMNPKVLSKRGSLQAVVDKYQFNSNKARHPEPRGLEINSIEEDVLSDEVQMSPRAPSLMDSDEAFGDDDYQDFFETEDETVEDETVEDEEKDDKTGNKLKDDNKGNNNDKESKEKEMNSDNDNNDENNGKGKESENKDDEANNSGNENDDDSEEIKLIIKDNNGDDTEIDESLNSQSTESKEKDKKAEKNIKINIHPVEKNKTIIVKDKVAEKTDKFGNVNESTTNELKGNSTEKETKEDEKDTHNNRNETKADMKVNRNETQNPADTDDSKEEKVTNKDEKDTDNNRKEKDAGNAELKENENETQNATNTKDNEEEKVTNEDEKVTENNRNGMKAEMKVTGNETQNAVDTEEEKVTNEDEKGIDKNRNQTKAKTKINKSKPQNMADTDDSEEEKVSIEDERERDINRNEKETGKAEMKENGNETQNVADTNDSEETNNNNKEGNLKDSKGQEECTFPFGFRGKTYHECTRDGDPDWKLWCATKTYPNGSYVYDKWKYCTDCLSDEFRCNNGECIPDNQHCNGKIDCPKDISDEENCTRCRMQAFNCGDGTCIPNIWVCDGNKDCSNGTDEDPEYCTDQLQSNLTDSKCGSTGWQCTISDQCITRVKRCDGDVDCDDGSDEANCTVCHGESFNCDNGECVPYSWRCDGEKDCANGHDEKNCDKSKPGVCLQPGSSCANNGICRKKCKMGECDNGRCPGSDCKCCLRTSSTKYENTSTDLIAPHSSKAVDKDIISCGLTVEDSSEASAFIQLVGKGSCSLKCIKLLKDRGLDINAKVLGRSALWYAINRCANCNKGGCAKLLVKHGANIEDAFNGPERTETKICDKCFKLFKRKKSQTSQGYRDLGKPPMLRNKGEPPMFSSWSSMGKPQMQNEPWKPEIYSGLRKPQEYGDQGPWSLYSEPIQRQRLDCKVNGFIKMNFSSWNEQCCMYTCINGRLQVKNSPEKMCSRPGKRCACCQAKQ